VTAGGKAFDLAFRVPNPWQDGWGNSIAKPQPDLFTNRLRGKFIYGAKRAPSPCPEPLNFLFQLLLFHR
jgi:hypothetical protein